VEKREMPEGSQGGNLKKRDHLKDLGTDGRKILKCILEQLDGRLQTLFIYLVQDKDKWQAAYTVKFWIFLTS
jgi:hypothetical protein